MCIGADGGDVVIAMKGGPEMKKVGDGVGRFPGLLVEARVGGRVSSQLGVGKLK
jgi:hypothetical protein